MWLLQKNLPAIVVVVVYAKQIMALGRREKKKNKKNHTAFLSQFSPTNHQRQGRWFRNTLACDFFLFFFFFVFALTFHAPCLPQPFKSYLPLSAGLHVKRVLPRASTAVLRGGRTSCGLRSAQCCGEERLLLSVNLRFLMRRTPDPRWVTVTFSAGFTHCGIPASSARLLTPFIY